MVGEATARAPPLIKACCNNSEAVIFNLEALSQKVSKRLIQAIHQSYKAKQPKKCNLSVFEQILKPSQVEESKILPSRFYRSQAKSSYAY